MTIILTMLNKPITKFLASNQFRNCPEIILYFKTLVHYQGNKFIQLRKSRFYLGFLNKLNSLILTKLDNIDPQLGPDLII